MNPFGLAVLLVWQSSDASLARATWGLFFVTGTLVAVTLIGVWWSIWDGRSRRLSDRARDRRELQWRTLAEATSRFGSPEMLFARKAVATDVMSGKLSTLLGKPPQHARRLLAFFMQIEQLLQSGDLAIDDVVRHFGDHIMIIGHKFGDWMADSGLKGRYLSFIRLFERVKVSDTRRTFRDEMDAYFDEQFWECEANL